MPKLNHILLAATLTIILGHCASPAPAQEPSVPMEIKVVVVKYLPVTADGKNVDIGVTGDIDGLLEEIRGKVKELTSGIIEALTEGSRFRGYKNQKAGASLRYSVVKEYEFLEPLPVYKSYPDPQVQTQPPLVDYPAIMERIDGKRWVEEEGVREIWLWGYHGGVVTLWESNMAGPHGDISNSSRFSWDLPIYRKTYTFYHYNYQRGEGEAVENHTHQIEALLNFVDGRDTTPPDKWPELLFWGKFVGSDASHKIVLLTRPDGKRIARCGWTHYAPNSEGDYDWSNKRFVETDIEDWKPDGTGQAQRLSCDRWQGDGLKWKIYWMQSLPGCQNGLKYRGKRLTNWWIFIGDFDRAMENKIGLVEK